jgi:uracil-DNA glycosylase family protein
MPSRKKPHEAVMQQIPADATLEELRRLSAGCKACDLWRNATQTVFGEGAEHAEVVLIGEQPGNQEDLQGHPFVGPAGKILDQALEQAGIERDAVYITNAVKHFKWIRKGKLRIHQKPRADEVEACRPWLEAELALTRPTLIVCMGATAAQALLGRNFRLTQHHGELISTPQKPPIIATIHPSAVLRAPSDEDRHSMMNQLVKDLKVAAGNLKRQVSVYSISSGSEPMRRGMK